jgi:hypothetical protein
MVEPLSVVDAREPLAVIDDGKTGRRTKPITTGKKSQTKMDGAFKIKPRHLSLMQVTDL